MKDARSLLESAMCLPDPWEGVARALDRALPGRGAMLYRWASPERIGRVAHTLATRSGWDALGDTKMRIEGIWPQLQIAGAFRSTGGPRILREVLRSADIAEEYRSAVLSPLDIRDQLRVVVQTPASAQQVWVGVFRAPRERPYSGEDAQVLRMLLPEVRRVLAAESIAQGPDGRIDPVLQVLNALPRPALLVDGLGTVVHANPAARESGSTSSLSGVRPARLPAHVAQVTRLEMNGRSIWLVLPVVLGEPQTIFASLPPSLREIARFVAMGLSDKEVAARSGRPLSTVRTYVERSFRALGVNSRAELVALAWRGRIKERS